MSAPEKTSIANENSQDAHLHDSPSSLQRVMIMAGGTGGHVIPALSLAKALTARGVEVHWLGSPRGIENTLVPRAGYPLHRIDVAGLRGKGLIGWLQAPFRLWRAVRQAKRILRDVSPELAVGMGGFASGPGGLAARRMKLPLVIHEQNALAGMTNKVLARMATRVYTAFPNALPDRVHPHVIGNPVRDEIAAQGVHLRSADEMAARRLRILVLGGSLGAKALNERLPLALAMMSENARPDVRHQAGRDKEEGTREHYANAGVKANVSAFIDDMAEAYDWADLVVCRSGALTVAELAAAGKPSLLVPFPFAVDDHQRFNARDLSDYGAAVLMPQSDMTAEHLHETLVALLDPETLASMAVHARERARLDAIDVLASGCMEIDLESH